MKFLRKRFGIWPAMVKAGAAEKPCPHCGKQTPQYEDGETKCLLCGAKIGEPKVVGGKWVPYDKGAGLKTADKFDVRPNESIRLPDIPFEAKEKRGK